MMVERVSRHREFNQKDCLVWKGVGENLCHTDFGTEVAFPSGTGEARRDEFATAVIFLIVEGEMDTDIFIAVFKLGIFFLSDILLEIGCQGATRGIRLTEKEDDACVRSTATWQGDTTFYISKE
jgi:hypothetical protein